MGQLAKLTAPQPGIAHPHKRPVKQRLGEGYTNNIFLMKKAGPARLAPRSAGCHHTINRDKLSHFPPQNRSKKESDRGTRPGGGKGVHWSLTGGGDELRLPARPLLILTRFQSTLTCQGRKKKTPEAKTPPPPLRERRRGNSSAALRPADPRGLSACPQSPGSMVLFYRATG